MPKQAVAEPGLTIDSGDGFTFHFGDDGTRQVSEPEADWLLNRYRGPHKVSVEDVPEPKPAAKNGGK